MSPYDDPAVSAGEIADYLYSHSHPNMTTESQNALRAAAEKHADGHRWRVGGIVWPELISTYETGYAAGLSARVAASTPIVTPDTSTPAVRPQTIGTIHCISINRLGQPQALRWYGTSAICGASGNAHTTQAQAEQDLLDWAEGRPVGYVQHAVTPIARYAPMVAAGVAAQRSTRTVRPRSYALAGLALLSLTLWFVGRLK